MGNEASSNSSGSIPAPVEPSSPTKFPSNVCPSPRESETQDGMNLQVLPIANQVDDSPTSSLEICVTSPTPTFIAAQEDGEIESQDAAELVSFPHTPTFMAGVSSGIHVEDGDGQDFDAAELVSFLFKEEDGDFDDPSVPKKIEGTSSYDLELVSEENADVELAFKVENERCEVTANEDGAWASEPEQVTTPTGNEKRESEVWETDGVENKTEPGFLGNRENEGVEDKVGKTDKKSAIRFFSQREVRNGKVLGEGGFGRVLKGHLHGSPVAIKLFHAPIDPCKINRELDLLMSLKHKCLLNIYGLVKPTDDGLDCPQVIFQYLPEGNLIQYLSNKTNPEDNGTLGKFALDIVEGCQYLRTRGIVHGNLAARNILVEKLVSSNKVFYNAKLSDMGIIRFAEPTGGNYMKLPGSGRIVPIRWVPKEIIEDDSPEADFTFASDIWALGVVLWEIWTRGAIPYGPSYSNLRVMQFIRDGYSPLKVHRPSECPPQIVNVMEKIFKLNPKERPNLDQLRKQFKIYKGFCKEMKSNDKSRDKSKPVKQEVTMTHSFVGDEDSTTPELKTGKKKRRKNSSRNKNKKAIPDATGAATKCKNFDRGMGHSSMRGAGAYPSQLDPGPRGSRGAEAVAGAYPSQLDPDSMSRSEQESTDATIAALLMRVNQLQSQSQSRRGEGTNLKKRLGPMQHSKGSRHDFNVRGGGTMGLGSEAALSTSRLVPAPQVGVQPPPPYTEDPLPHHSSAFSREVTPGPSQEFYGHGYRQARGRGRRLDRSRSGNGQGREEDFIRKIRRLAEEIEVLRAEKMTQELLKKSAELADLMKYMTIGEGSGAGSSWSRGDARAPDPVYEAVDVPQNRAVFDDGYHATYHGYHGDMPPPWQGQNERSYYYQDPMSQPRSPPQLERPPPNYRRGNERGSKGFGRYGGYGDGHYGPGSYRGDGQI